MNKNKRLEEIEKEMKKLFPKKELAYADYIDNTGDTTGLRERLLDDFRCLRDQWNNLVDKYSKLKNKE